MNKNLLIATAITAGTVALYYLVKRKIAASRQVPQIPVQRSRHLTDYFAKAKPVEHNF